MAQCHHYYTDKRVLFDLEKFKWIALRHRPVASHPACQVVAPLLSLHKDDGLVFFLGHDLLHELDQSSEAAKTIKWSRYDFRE